MRKIPALLIFLAVSLLLGQPCASSQTEGEPGRAQSGEITPEMKEVLDTINHPLGYINEDLYDQFWANVSEPEGRAGLRKSIDLNLIRGQQYQREAWEYIRDTAKARYPPPPRRLNSIKNEYLSALRGGGVLTTENRIGIDLSFEQTDMLVEAALNETPFESPEGPVSIDVKLAEQKIDEADRALSKLKLLISKEWPDEPPLHEYKGPYLKIRSWSRLHCMRAPDRGQNEVWEVIGPLSPTARVMFYYEKSSSALTGAGDRTYTTWVAEELSKVDGNPTVTPERVKSKGDRPAASWQGVRTGPDGESIYSMSRVWLTKDKRKKVMARVESSLSADEARDFFRDVWYWFETD